MRILPLAFYCENAWDPLIPKVAGLTHNHPISHACCIAYIYLAQMLAREVSLENALHALEPILKTEYGLFWQEIKRIFDYAKPRNEIKSTGYVVDTLNAAIWALHNTKTYKSCILKAVNLGDDTDTIAAVAGGLAGIKYGFDRKCGIPWEWIQQLGYRREIMDIYLRFEGALRNAKTPAAYNPR